MFPLGGGEGGGGRGAWKIARVVYRDERTLHDFFKKDYSAGCRNISSNILDSSSNSSQQQETTVPILDSCPTFKKHALEACDAAAPLSRTGICSKIILMKTFLTGS